MTVLPPGTEARFRGLRRLIGNTPLLAIEYAFRGQRRRMWSAIRSFTLPVMFRFSLFANTLRLDRKSVV